MIMHIELVERITDIAIADKCVDEDMLKEYRRITTNSPYYVRIVGE